MAHGHPAGALPAGLGAAVRVPASSANLGPGFDSVGIALGIWDECEATVTHTRGLVIEVSGEGTDEVPRDGRHLVHRTMVTAWSRLGVSPPPGLRLTTRNAVPHGRGLGSSATAIVMGIVLAHVLAAQARLVPGVDLGAVNDLAAELEGHPDNSSASVFGGLTLSWSDPDQGMPATSTLQAPLHGSLRLLVVVPDVQLSTAKARSVLPQQVRLADAVRNSARAALLVHALGHDPDLLLPATREWLHQEARRGSYPDSMALVDRLRSAGHAAVISGAGPSVLVMSTQDRLERAVDLVTSGWQVLRPEIPDVGAQLLSGSTSGVTLGPPTWS